MEPLAPRAACAQVMAAFHAEGDALLTTLQADVQKMRGGLQGLAAFLGDKIDADEPEQVLARINAFSVSFCKACRDNERAEHLKKKQEKAEAERLQRRASGVPSSRKVPVKKVSKTSEHYMNRIQGSLRRGEFDQMKAPQMQMKSEIEGKMLARRNSIKGRQ